MSQPRKVLRNEPAAQGAAPMQAERSGRRRPTAAPRSRRVSMQDLFGRHLTRPPDRSTRARSPGAENILPLIPGPRRRLDWYRHLSGEGEEWRALPCRSEQLDLAPGHAATPSDQQQRNRAQRLVSYVVRTTPPGNVRVSTRFRFTQLSSAVKNGVPPPTSTGRVTISYSSTPGPHGRPSERGATDPHRLAVVGLEPGDLRYSVAGDQAGVPVDLVDRRGEHHLRRVPPVPRELDLRRGGVGLLVAGRPVGTHRLPQLAPVHQQPDRQLLVEPPLKQLVAGPAPAEVVAGRGDVAVQGQVHAVDQFPHGAMPFCQPVSGV